MSDCECVEKKCPEGIPAWVMTFADLMSLLLAFFVLLFSFSEMDKNVYKEMAGSLKDAFGVQREIKVKESPRGINIIAREFSPGRPEPTVSNEVRQMTTNDSQALAKLPDSETENQENDYKKGADQDSTTVTLSEEDLEITRLIKKDSELLQEVLDEEIAQGMIDMKITQTRIILMVREKGSFPSGSAQIIAPFKVVAEKISKVFTDFEGIIIVSGHTDNVPINTYRFRSNWELSSSRAVSVIHELSKETFLKNKRFEISAYADTKPVDTNETFIGRSKNRRVEIMMDYSKKGSGDQPVESDENAVKTEIISENGS